MAAAFLAAQRASHARHESSVPAQRNVTFDAQRDDGFLQLGPPRQIFVSCDSSGHEVGFCDAQQAARLIDGHLALREVMKQTLMTAILSFVDWIGRFTDAEYALLRHRMRGVQFMGPNIMRRWDVATAVNWIDIGDPIVPAFKQSLITEGILTSARADVIFDLTGTGPDPPSGSGSGSGVDAIMASTIDILPGNGGGPLVVADDFNRADGPLGPNWILGVDAFAPVIQSQTLAGVSSGNWSTAYWNPDVNLFPPDQYSEVTNGNGGRYVGVTVRQRPASVGAPFGDSYILIAGGGPTTIFRFTNSVTQLIQFDDSASTGDTIRLEVRGSTLTAYRNGVVLGSVDDTVFADGQPGVGVYSDFCWADNWSAGSLA